jgi:hypothetical protein
MTLAQIVRDAQSLSLRDEDGDPVTLKLLSALTPEEMHQFERGLPCPVPNEVRDLLRLCRGVNGLAFGVLDFTGASLSFGHPEVFPHGLPVAGDGYGNFWVLDLLPGTTSWGPVYFDCHDPPIVLFQSDSLATFLLELIKMSIPPHASAVDDVHEDRLFDVWMKNPGVQSYEQCRSSTDAALARFARSLGPTFEFIDMRSAPVGFGFSWGRYGANTVIRRAGAERIFAYQRKVSLLRSLFGAPT